MNLNFVFQIGFLREKEPDLLTGRQFLHSFTFLHFPNRYEHRQNFCRTLDLRLVRLIERQFLHSFTSLYEIETESDEIFKEHMTNGSLGWLDGRFCVLSLYFNFETETEMTEFSRTCNLRLFRLIQQQFLHSFTSLYQTEIESNRIFKEHLANGSIGWLDGSFRILSLYLNFQTEMETDRTCD